MPQSPNVAQICGQLIVGGFDGVDVPAAVLDSLRRGELGGVILFKRNLPTIEAAHAACSKVVQAATLEAPPFIGVDQEGGRVVRLPSPFLRLPAMRVFGDRGDLALARRAAAMVARQLAALGFNLNFAPVLDVDSNPENPIIGDRSFSSDPDTVARLGRAFVEGLQSENVMACGKHFPGHGDTSKDSHVDLPIVEHDKQRLDAVELPPFRTAALRGLAALMTAHVVYPGLDAGVPATLSHRICTTLLRNEIGFSGVLFSDDLEMKALADRMDVEKSAVGAIRAGCDVLLICRDLDLQRRAHAALIAKAESDSGFLARCQHALSRGLAARRKFRPRPFGTSAEALQLLADPEVEALQSELAAEFPVS
jgi:beta-N-acetylhexosaminidase